MGGFCSSIPESAESFEFWGVPELAAVRAVLTVPSQETKSLPVTGAVIILGQAGMEPSRVNLPSSRPATVTRGALLAGQWWEQRGFPSHHLVIRGKELFKSWHDLRSTNGQVGWCNAAPESWSQDNEVIGFVLPGWLVWEEDVKLFLSREAGNFKSLVVQAVLLWSRIPISQNQSRERPGCGKELTEFLDGISVVGQSCWWCGRCPEKAQKSNPLLWRIRAPMNLPRLTVWRMPMAKVLSMRIAWPRWLLSWSEATSQ